ncbi:hypothetical protein CH252_15855 [Rhodococcus sp. 06-1477-1B]|nr:hypothetical protein CH252_15855 [Rhodococcus sp. 06-1477-1B]
MDQVMLSGLIAAFIAVSLIILLTVKYEHRELVLTWLVGATGALMALQVAQVHVFTIVVILWALLTHRSGRLPVPVESVVVVGAAVILASTVLFGALVNSQTLGLQLVALAVSAAVVGAHVSRAGISRMLEAVLAIVTASSAWALLQVAGVAPIEAWHLDVSALGRPVGFYPEPDWLGLFSGIGILLAWRLPLGRLVRAALLTLNIAAWVLAFARAAWIALAVAAILGAAVYFLMRHRDEGSPPRRGRWLGVGFVSVTGFLAFELIPSLHDNVLTRLSRTFTVAADDISAQARVNQNAGMLELAQSAPWYGWGLSASGRVGVFGGVNVGEVSRNNVGSNWILSFWAEGGVLSLPLFAVIAVAIALTARTISAQLLLVVLINSVFSNAMYQPIAWLLLGLCLAQIRLWRDDRLAIDEHAKGSKLPSDVPGDRLPGVVAGQSTSHRA